MNIHLFKFITIFFLFLFQISMKHAIFLTLFFLAFLNTRSLTQQNLVIGVYTQKYFYGDHNATTVGKILTYVAPTYSNIGSIVGAKAVPIYSYSSKQQILAQLSLVNGIIFTGGEEYININNTWTANAKVILEYAKKENDQGRTFPILGICQGLELMLYLTSDMRADFLDPIIGQNGVWNTLRLVDNDYYLLEGLSDQTQAAITDPRKTKQGGPLFFYHSNGTLLSTFQNDRDLSSFWNLIGTTSKGNQTFVTYLEAKNYPFYITQFHPERLAFSYQLSDELFQARAQLISRIALNFGIKCKQNPHRYPRDSLNGQVIQNFPTYESTRFDYRVFLFEESTSISQPKKEGLTDITDFVGFVSIAAILGGAVYYLIKKKKQSQALGDRSLETGIQRDQYIYQNNYPDNSNMRV